MTRKRDRLEIIHDILSIIREKESIKPTHILYKSNLSHQMLKDYLSELLEKQLVAESVDRKGAKKYSLTDKGQNFLKDYSTMRGFIDSYGLD